jgi:hypothetical protein
MVLAVCIVSGCEKQFAIKDVSPPTGVLGGGEPVNIRGAGFHSNMGISVYFGNTKSETVVVNSPEKLTVTTPSAAEAKTVDVRIMTDDGKQYIIKRGFRYIEKTGLDIRDLNKRTSRRDKPE